MKISILLMALIFSEFCFADKLIITRTTHQGVTVTDVFENTKDGYFSGGKFLGRDLSAKNRKNWEILFSSAQSLKVNEVLSKECAAGTYSVSVEIGSPPKSYIYRGCLENPTFAKLAMQTRSLRAISNLKK
ncbi:MAG: hypothetical protein ACM3MG_01555 [Bacillota bacterium]